MSKEPFRAGASTESTRAMADASRASTLLLDLIVGKWLSQAICAAAELGIADLLKDGPRSSTEIAAATGASEDGVYRLLRALGCVGLFTESGPSWRRRASETVATSWMETFSLHCPTAAMHT